MKTFSRVAGSSALAILLVLVSMAPAAGVGAAQPASLLPQSPISGSVLMAQAIRSGAVTPVGSAPAPQNSGTNLTCSPAPCALPNVQASEGGQPVNEDPIAVNPSNSSQLLTGGNDYNCATLQGFFTSGDGGSTWTHTCMPAIAGGSGDGDPAVGYDLHNEAYAMGIQNNSSGYHIVLMKSSNNGTTWSTPTIAINPLFSGGLTDKEWLQIDTTSTSPHANNLYVSITQFNSSFLNEQISVSRSSDGGTTFATVGVSAVAVFPNVNQFSDLAVGKDGTVYLTWLNCNATGATGDCGGTLATMFFSKSTDGGVSWTAPVSIASATLAPDPSSCCFYGALPKTSERVSDIPAIDVDNSSGVNSGHLYVVMYNWTGTQMQLEVVTSTNGGTTWSAPHIVVPADTNNQFFPWLTVSSSGTIGVTWLDGRPGTTSETYNAMAAVSLNGGSTYTKGIRISTASSNTSKDGFGGGFMGDYTGNMWAGKTLYASWMDMRNGVDSQDEVGGLMAK